MLLLPYLAGVALAQVSTPGPFIPLTNTRYRGPGVPAVASLAANGKTILAAWRTATDIHVAVVDGEGVGIPVLHSRRYGKPALAAFGNGYVVAESRDAAIDVAFLSGDGRIADIEGIPIPSTTSLALASSGGLLLALYQRNSHLEASLINATHQLVATSVIDGRALNSSDLRLAVASNGTSFLIAESFNDAIRVIPVSAAGSVGAASIVEGQLVDPFARNVDIASDGSQFLVAWSANGVLKTQRFDAAGNATTTLSIAAEGGSAQTRPYAPAIAWDGARYVCAYVNGYSGSSGASGSIDIVAIDRNGSRLFAQTTNPSPAGSPAIAAGTAGTVVAWSSFTPYFAQMVGSEGPIVGVFAHGASISDAFLISIGSDTQTAPATVTNGNVVFVAWTERSVDRLAIRSGILSAGGSWKENAEIPIANLVDVRPVVTTDGSNFLVAWSNRAIRLDSNGNLLDPVPIALDTRLSVTSAAFGGSSYVLVGSSNDGIAAQPLSASGNAGGFKLIRPASGDTPTNPQIAASGTDFLVTFPVTTGCPGIFPCFADQSGRALLLASDLTAAGREIVLYDDAVIGTAVAWNGSEYLAVVRDYASVLGRRLSRDGVELDASPIPIYVSSTASPRISNISMISSGGRFILGWRNETDVGQMTLAAVEQDGRTSILLNFDNGIESSSDPQVIQLGSETNLIASALLRETPYYGSERLIRQALFSSFATTPPAPSVVAGPIVHGSVTLQWSPVANAIGYRAEYQHGSAGWLEAEGFLGSDRTSATIQGLRDGDQYSFRVRAWGLSSVSPYSNVVAPAIVPRRRAIAH
jgi:hypothetical protein